MADASYRVNPRSEGYDAAIGGRTRGTTCEVDSPASDLLFEHKFFCKHLFFFDLLVVVVKGYVGNQHKVVVVKGAFLRGCAGGADTACTVRSACIHTHTALNGWGCNQSDHRSPPPAPPRP